ncbi:MAG: LamG domain-containing protein [Bacteroidota bacterium]
MKHFKLFYFTFLLLPFFSANAQLTPVAHYPFDGNANDASGNGYDGTVHGATLTTDRFGNANSAYSFSGFARTDSIDCGYIRELNSAGEYTVSCWVNQTTLDLPRGVWTYRETDNVLTNAIFLQLRTYSDGNLWGYQGGAFVGYDYSNDVSAGQWHQFATVFDVGNDSVKLYIDGEQVASAQAGGTRVFHGDSLFTHFFIGLDAYNYFPGGTWNGKLDDFYIFDRALTASQIDSLYNLPDPNGCTVNIPDANLKASLTHPSHGIDLNSNGEIECSEAAAVTTNFYPMTYVTAPVTDFTGLEAFTNVTWMDISSMNNNATSIDFSGNTKLTDLFIVNCSTVTSITLNCPDLNWLDARMAGLTSIDITSVDTLRVLKLADNPLMSITGEDRLYSWLSVKNCPINTTDFSGAVNLKNLEAINSGLTAIDLSAAPDVDYVQVMDCQALTSLNVANGNNSNFLNFNATNTPNLHCITVDDPNNFGWPADPTDVFSTNCLVSVEASAFESLG